MKIVAYVNGDYIYYVSLLPKLGKECEVLPLVLCETLHKLKKAADAPLPDLYADLWDYILGREHYDGIWCYGLPDEICIAKSRQYGVPVLIQEYFGHYPGNLSGIFSLDADYQTFYKSRSLPETTGMGKKDAPVICLAFSLGLYDHPTSLGAWMENYEAGGRNPGNPYWRVMRMYKSYRELAEIVVGLCRETPELQDCEVRLRPHPRYPEIFADVIDYANALNDPRYRLSREPVGEMLETTDVLVHVNSNCGFDALRAGCEVISVGGFSFFSNPQLQTVVYEPGELLQALKTGVENIRQRGKQVKSFLPPLLEDMAAELHHPCLEPYPDGRLFQALSYAVSMPLLVRQ